MEGNNKKLGTNESSNKITRTLLKAMIRTLQFIL